MKGNRMKRLRYWLIRRLGGHPPLELIPVRGLNVWNGPLSDEEFCALRAAADATAESKLMHVLRDKWHEAG